ncbi:MAG: outer membrane lipoprotein-sorting protein, partial [Planctomycetaceae bacterium]|nr:outer membrane lipoprotein-sorting protein [Planctomycetaceae bacterium]
VIYWIAPDKGYAPLRVELNSLDGTILDSTEVEVENYSGIWLPVKSVYQRKNEKGEVTEEQKLSVEILSVNKPLPDSVFHPEGFDVEINTDVDIADNPYHERFFWNGKDIQGTSGMIYGEERKRPNLSLNVRLFFIITGLFMISVACFWKYLERRRNRTD